MGGETMNNTFCKLGKRLVSLWKASSQLRIGLILFALVLLVAVFAGVLSPFDPYFLGEDLLVPPGSPNHPLGTNQMGCDILSMILHGSRASLAIGFQAVSSMTPSLISKPFKIS